MEGNMETYDTVEMSMLNRISLWLGTTFSCLREIALNSDVPNE